MCKDNDNHINNYEEKDDHDHSNDDEDEDGGVCPQGCAADFLPALRIQIRCQAGKGPRRRKGKIRFFGIEYSKCKNKDTWH